MGAMAKGISDTDTSGWVVLRNIEQHCAAPVLATAACALVSLTAAPVHERVIDGVPVNG